MAARCYCAPRQRDDVPGGRVGEGLVWEGGSEGARERGMEQVAAGERRYQEEENLRQQTEGKGSTHLFASGAVRRGNTAQDHRSESQRTDTQHAAGDTTETKSRPSKILRVK